LKFLKSISSAGLLRDNGGRSLEKLPDQLSLENFLSTKGVTLNTTCPHIPEQNMHIERVWRTIGESAIAMLLTANLSEV